jgi:hypothetical protein
MPWERRRRVRFCYMERLECRSNYLFRGCDLHWTCPTAGMRVHRFLPIEKKLFLYVAAERTGWKGASPR